ncbi:MAG: adenylate/guanylate cyclase domain-containing protein [Candidatus Promineifilaceae bacterium]|nr:adenylate/guanylate cyclase domain-containing protein [Candidatus Promineifilaceae bacterium]
MTDANTEDVPEPKRPPLDLDNDSLRQVVQSLGLGVAVVDTDDWAVLFENANFFKWFPPHRDADEPLPERVAGFRVERAKSRLDAGRSYSLETEVEPGGRTIPIEVEARPLPDQQIACAVVECRDLTKQRQAEYMLESYSKMAERNARELEREKDRVERLLLNIMPKSVYEEMKDYGTVTPQLFDSASILMVDFVGHTDMDIARDPAALVTELNDIFNVFDRITDLFGCERIRTVGDAYVAVSGIPEPSPDHAHNTARVALRMLRYIERRNSAHPEAWHCRIGINSGPVIGSLVGVQKYVYDIFGPGINLAARMETLSESMQITISQNTYELLKDDFYCVERGEFEVKGFGKQTLYALERELPRLR